jgi:NTE family protein
VKNRDRILSSILLLLAFPAWGAEPQPAQSRPKVGLVLAGGGALGLAHVGVIRWLEEHRIPVDYVTGTSMGGLVGGLYATGHDAKSMEEFVDAIDWPLALQVNTPFPDLAFRRKEDRREFPNALEFGLKDGFNLPSGLSPGHGVGLVLSRFTAPYADLRSFDDLPIPFRCVAVDLETGNQVVFSNGSLFDALRATMSIPGVFAPRRSGKQLLVDGGTLNNIPIDIVKQMGAEVIIAVGLDTPPKKESAHASLLDVAQRSISVMITDNERRNIRELRGADLLLLPDLAGFDSSDFDRGKELAARGYEEAVRKARFLETLAVDENTWKAILASRATRTRPETLQPQFVDVKGMPEAQGRAILRSVTANPGEPADRSKLENELTEITGLGRYESADYRAALQNGQQGLEVQVHPKNYGPPFLNTGIYVQGSNGTGLQLGIGARLTFLNVLAQNSEWRADFSVGTNDLLATEYYYRVHGSRFFIAPGVTFSQQTADFHENGKSLFEYKVRELRGYADLGFAISRNSEFRIGYDIGHLHTYVTNGNPPVTPFSGMTSAAHLRYAYDGMDNILPNNGVHFILDGQWVNRWPGAATQFPVLKSEFSFAKTFHERYTVLNFMSGGTTAGRTQAGLPPFTLGGPLLLSALAPYQLLGDEYYYNGLYLMRSLSTSKLSFIGKFRLIAGYELGNAWVSGDPPKPFQDGVAGIVGQTGLGIVFFGGSVGEHGEGKLLFRLGRFF